MAEDRITIFAAASLRTALESIASEVEAESGTRIILSLAASSALARQIEHGAPADIFISANTAWMDHLAMRGRIAVDTRIDIAGNRLALIAPAAGAGQPTRRPLTRSVLSEDFAEGRVAVAFVEAVPAGIYARAALTALDAWTAWAPRLVQTDNVRTALALVALGEVPYGIVYDSDAAAEPRVRVLGLFPQDSHPPIVYPAAALSGRDGPGVRAVLAHIAGPVGRAALARAGFLPASRPAAQ